MPTSKWLDQRDIPDARWGKVLTPGCECTHIFTCRACLQRAHTRNMAEIAAAPLSHAKQNNNRNQEKKLE